MSFTVKGECAGPFQLRIIPVPTLSATAAPDPAITEHEPTRLVAAALAVALGPFGAHRLYLGTNAKVPVFYGLTFGGFGVLVLIDLGHILFTKDLGPYEHNKQILMWAEKGTATGPTPP